MNNIPHFKQALAETLQKHRKRLNLSQMKLAVAIGASEGGIRSLERGEQTTYITTFILLAKL